jgi:hypothetical protein
VSIRSFAYTDGYKGGEPDAEAGNPMLNAHGVYGNISRRLARYSRSQCTTSALRWCCGAASRTIQPSRN